MKEDCLATELIGAVLLNIRILSCNNRQRIRLMHTIHFTSLLKANRLSFFHSELVVMTSSFNLMYGI